MQGMRWGLSCGFFAEEATTLSVYIETLKKAVGLGCDKFVIGHYPDLLDSKYLENFLDCATHVDYSKGIPFKNPIIQGYEARICANGEIHMDKIGDPNFPMLVVSENKIDCLGKRSFTKGTILLRCSLTS